MAIFGRGNGAVEKDGRPVDRGINGPAKYAPPEKRHAEAVVAALKNLNSDRDDNEEFVSGGCGGEGHAVARTPQTFHIDLGRMEHDIDHKCPEGIEGMKELARRLTYGEMVELARQISAKMPKVEAEDTKSLIVMQLPQTIHDWCTDAPIEEPKEP